MYRYIFDNHELRVEPSSISQDFNLYIYHLICWKKGSSTRAQKLDVYNNFRNEYRFCPYCGQQMDLSSFNVLPQNTYQHDTIASVEQSTFNVNKWILGGVVAILCCFGIAYFGFKKDLINAGIVEPTTESEQFAYALKSSKEKKYDIALKWYQKLADKGNAAALNNLGVMYENGRGVEANIKTAFKYYLKAAELGDEYGQLNVAYLYLDGDGTIKNKGEALKWIKKSADQGHIPAIAELGYQLYLDNKYNDALPYFQKAADANNSFGQRMLGEFYMYGYANLNKDQAKAFELYKKSANQNDKVGKYKVSYCLRHGVGVNKNVDEGIKWLKESAEDGYKLAMSDLAGCYVDGEGVPVDYAEARKWYKKSGIEDPDKSIQLHKDWGKIFKNYKK